MKLLIASRSGRLVVDGGLHIDAGETVDGLLAEMHSLSLKKLVRIPGKPILVPERQRFTLPLVPGAVTADGKKARPVALASGKKLSDYNLKDGDTLHFKDLGQQVGYVTVFFWEYFGPMVVYPLVYYLPKLLYPESMLQNGECPRHPVQAIATAYWSFHFAKRILETFFVHKFSHGTMPIFNLLRNCSYYWAFAAFVSYFVNHPLYTPPPFERSKWALAGAMLMQAGNLYSHVILANLRPKGSKEYRVPRGFLFNYVTCANYTFEILGWLLFNVATQSIPGILFMFAGGYQMTLWAIAKHKRLKRTFDGKEGREKYPRRFIILPPLI